MVLQAIAAATVCSVLAVCVKGRSPELALALSAVCCVGIGLVLVQLAAPILEFVKAMQSFTGLQDALLRPVWKTVGVCLLSQIAAAFCSDAGEQALAKMVELCGSVLCLYLSLPLLQAVYEMIQTMAGG